jgi:uncharacterized phiE125 gp8 family phage protein
MKTTIVTAPTKEPISRALFKEHARISITDDDDYIDNLIQAVRRQVEQITNRALITQTWKLYLNDWPQGDYIKLPYPPLQTVTSVKYRESDYTESTMDSGDYRVLTNVEPGQVALDYGAVWPSETLIGNEESIYIEYTCGFGDERLDVPDDIRHACLMLCAHYYEMREPTVIGTILTPVPMTVDRLLADHRRSRFGL